MPHTNVVSRSLHDIGLAAWFGGTLFGAVGLNESAARAVDDDAVKAAAAGWQAWTPVNMAAIGAHVVGATGLLLGNKARVVGQRGVASVSIVKTAVLAASLGATAYSRMIGQRVILNSAAPADGGVDPNASTPSSVASAQQQLKTLQWVLPTLTGAMVVLNALQGEMQRPTQVMSGVIGRLKSN